MWSLPAPSDGRRTSASRGCPASPTTIPSWRRGLPSGTITLERLRAASMVGPVDILEQVCVRARARTRAGSQRDARHPHGSRLLPLCRGGRRQRLRRGGTKRAGQWSARPGSRALRDRDTRLGGRPGDGGPVPRWARTQRIPLHRRVACDADARRRGCRDLSASHGRQRAARRPAHRGRHSEARADGPVRGAPARHGVPRRGRECTDYQPRVDHRNVRGSWPAAGRPSRPGRIDGSGTDGSRS